MTCTFIFRTFFLAVLSAPTCHFSLLYAWHFCLFVFVSYQSSVLVIEFGDMSKYAYVRACVRVCVSFAP